MSIGLEELANRWERAAEDLKKCMDEPLYSSDRLIFRQEYETLAKCVGELRSVIDDVNLEAKADMAYQEYLDEQRREEFE